jgi:hypothetical protein
VFDRGPVTIQTYDSVGNLTSDPLAMYKPAYRIADCSASDAAYFDVS